MPRTAVSAQHPSVAGTQLTYTAVTAGAGNGDMVRPNAVLLVRNGSGSALTVTLITGGTVDGLAIADATVTVPAGADMAIGPFGAVYPQPSGVDVGQVYVEYSSATTITRAVVGSVG